MPSDCPADVYPPPPDSVTAENSGISDEKKELILDIESVISEKTSMIPTYAVSVVTTDTPKATVSLYLPP